MCAQGQCHRVQQSNPPWAQGTELWEKGLQETFSGQGCLCGLRLRFSSGPHPWSLPKLHCTSAYVCSHPSPILTPSLALELLHPHGCGHSPQPGSACCLWGGGMGPWGEVPALTCPAALCLPPWQLRALTLSPDS